MAKRNNNAAMAAIKAQGENAAVVTEAIFNAVAQGFADLQAGGQIVRDAKALADSAAAEHGVRDGGRIGVMKTLAKLANDNDWHDDHTAAAVERWFAANNRDRDAKSYKNDVLRVCAKAVRFQIGAMFDRATAAFDADRDAMKSAYKRRYHFAMNTLLPLAEAGKPVPDNAAECVEMARKAGAPVRSAAQHASKVSSIVEQLKALPHCRQIADALKALESITSDTFKSAASVTAQTKAMDKQAAEQRAVERKPAPEAPQGVSDILDELQSDLVAMQGQHAAQHQAMLARMVALKTRIG